MEADRTMMQRNSESISEEASLEDFFVVGAESNNNRVVSQNMLGWVTLLTSTKDTTSNIIPYPVWKAYMDQQIRQIHLKKPQSY